MSLSGFPSVTPFILWQGEKGGDLIYVSPWLCLCHSIHLTSYRKVKIGWFQHMSLPGSAFVTPFILWQSEKRVVLTYVSPGFASVTPFILWQCEKWGWFYYMSLPGFPSVMQFF